VPSPVADDAFGAALYAALPAGGNLVLSPVSIALALRLALLGARGDTATELAAALRLAGPEQAAGELPGLAARLDGLAGGPVTLRAPATLWLQAGLPLQPGYTAALAGLAGVAVHEADFARAAEAAREEINALIAAQTGGKITGLLGPATIGVATRAVLASAIYLKAAWARPFPGGATADGPFHPEPGRAVEVPLMHLAARLRYRRGDGYQVVELPYANGPLAMLIVLPDGPLGPVEAQLAAAGVAGLAGGAGGGPGAAPDGLGLRLVRLALPRFRVTSVLDLRSALTALGAERIFRGDADFSGLTEAMPLHVSAVAHKAYLDVDEQGTEAAAATAVVARAMARISTGEPPVEMVVDRPFLYAIVDSGSGEPLFLGRVTDPAAT
jgi:serpin B